MKVIAVTKGSHIIEGEFEPSTKEFKTGKILTSFEDEPNFDKYKSFKKYQNLLGINMNETKTKKFLEKLGLKKLWFYDKLPELSDVKTFKKHWFNYTNVKCQACKLKCKQSSKVDIFKCKDYKKK